MSEQGNTVEFASKTEHPTPSSDAHVPSDGTTPSYTPRSSEFEREIPQVPTFYPEEQQMDDFLSYVRDNLMSALQQHGIVRIRPPASVALENIQVDFEKSTISTTMQRLGSLDGMSRLRLREKNGITLFITSRNTGINPKSLIDAPEARAQNEEARAKYHSYVRLCKERGSLYTRLPLSHEKVCLACNKSIKRERKVKCLLCPRQFHMCCLPSDSHPWMSNVWYCDHCICFPVETFFNRNFAYPIVTTPVKANLGQSAADEEISAQPEAGDHSQEMSMCCSNAPAIPHTKPMYTSVRSKINWSDNGPCVSMSQLRDASVRLRQQHFPDADASPSIDQLERLYWTYLDDEYNSTEVMFTSGLLRDDQVIDYIQRTPKYSAASYNLAKMRNHHDSLLKREQSAGDIGILSGPWFPSGMMFSTVPWHIEDHFLFAISWLHMGDPRMWYSVPADCYDAFEQEIHSKLEPLFAGERKLLNHYFTMYNPYRLPSDIPVYKVIQELGDIIIMFPKAYHSAFNFGFSVTEAIDVATPEWLPFAHQATCAYLKMGRRPLFNVLDLIVGFCSCHSEAPSDAESVGHCRKSCDPAGFQLCLKQIEQELQKFFLSIPIQLAQFSKIVVKDALRQSNSSPNPAVIDVCDMNGCYQYVKHISWACSGCDGIFCSNCVNILTDEQVAEIADENTFVPAGIQVYCPMCQPDIRTCQSKTASLSLGIGAEKETTGVENPFDPSSINLFSSGSSIRLPRLSNPIPPTPTTEKSSIKQVTLRVSEALSTLIHHSMGK